MKIIITALLLISSLHAQELSVPISPSNCTDLLPNYDDYISFFESVGDLWFYSNPSKSKQIYKVLACRKIYQEDSKINENPVNEIIRTELCNCYLENDNKIYTADSAYIKKCLSSKLTSMQKDAANALTEMKIKEELIQRSSKKMTKNNTQINNLKNITYLEAKKELNKKVYSKIKAK